jgi:sugar diacid utilization regulator
VDALQPVVDALARQVGRSVAVDDASFRLLAYSSHAGVADPARLHVILERQAPAAVVAWARSVGVAPSMEPTLLPANPELGILRRWCVPVGCHGSHFGYLWLIDEVGSLPQGDRERAVAAAHEAGLILFRERLTNEARESERRELVRDLLGDDGPARTLAVERLVEDGSVPPDRPMQVVVTRVLRPRTEPPDAADRLQLALALERSVTRVGGPPRLVLARLDHGIAIVARDDVSGFVDVLCNQMESHCRGEVIVGVGPVVTGPEQLRQSYVRAVRALRVAELVDAHRPVAWSSALGVYELLAELTPDALGDTVRGKVARLLEDESLARTVECFLDAAGDTKIVSERLHMHRATVYQRLRRAEQLAGVSLDSGQERLVIHLGLKAARLTGALTDGPSHRFD